MSGTKPSAASSAILRALASARIVFVSKSIAQGAMPRVLLRAGT
jgi:hypothetical protein